MRVRVLQVNCHLDPQQRSPEELLEAWATLPLVAGAVARAGAGVTVLQAAGYEALHHADEVTYRFVPPRRLVDEVRRARPDIVHFHGFEHPRQLRAICSVGHPVLAQDHASSPRTWPRLLRRWGLNKVAAVAFTSREQAIPFHDAGQLPRRVPVLEIPECTSDFTPGDREEARARSGVFGDPALLWVGHLDANKDPVTILEAVRIAAHHLPELQLWCAFGSDCLLPRVEGLLSEDPALAQRVHLLGRVPRAQIETLCRACDLFVLGSHREGSGYALIEALACGLTPIVSDIPSFRVLTGSGANGALVPTGDAAAFAAQIVALAVLPQREAREQVRGHFAKYLSPDALGWRLLEAYRTTVAGLG